MLLSCFSLLNRLLQSAIEQTIVKSHRDSTEWRPWRSLDLRGSSRRKWPALLPWTAAVKWLWLGLGSFDSSSSRAKIPFDLASTRSMQS